MVLYVVASSKLEGDSGGGEVAVVFGVYGVGSTTVPGSLAEGESPEGHQRVRVCLVVGSASTSGEECFLELSLDVG